MSIKHLWKFINWISYEKVMNMQNCGTHNFKILGFLLKIIKKKKPFQWNPHGEVWNKL